MRKAFVYTRGRKLWFCYDDATGTRRQQPSGLDVGSERLAEEALRKIVARIEAGIDLGEADQGPVTVTRYEKKWTDDRKVQGLASAAGESARIRTHALPAIGSLKIEEVRPRHIRDLVRALRASGELAPRTIRHVYGVLHTMFRDAVVDELIPTNPCVLKRGDLPKKADKDPTWRASAVFTRAELEQLLSDDRIPVDRRVLYALLGLAGLRFGEAAALRWRHYDTALEPLGRLIIAASYCGHARVEKSTKTEAPRLVPVHPVLARVLAEWKLGGFEQMVGRPAVVDDLIMPSRIGRNRNVWTGLEAFYRDLENLGFRRRRQHDLRRTFISLARADGARKDILETVTHGERGDIVDAYTTMPWEAVCAEVAKLRVKMVGGKVLAMPERRLAAVAE